MIQIEQAKKVWYQVGQEFLWSFNNFVTNAVVICKAQSLKKSALADKNIRSLKKVIHRYLEEKLT